MTVLKYHPEDDATFTSCDRDGVISVFTTSHHQTTQERLCDHRLGHVRVINTNYHTTPQLIDNE